MDQVERYRQIVRQVIEDYAALGNPDPAITTEVVEDRNRNHFELKHVGWDRRRRIHGTVLHLDIIDGKIWVQHDGTERPVAEELAAAGVPKEDIIIAYKPADVRPFTGYGVG